MDLIQGISITLQRCCGYNTESLAGSRNRLSHWALPVGTEPHTTNKGIDPQRPKSITAYLLELVGQAQEFGTHSKSNAMSFGNLSAIGTAESLARLYCSKLRVRGIELGDWKNKQ